MTSDFSTFWLCSAREWTLNALDAGEIFSVSSDIFLWLYLVLSAVVVLSVCSCWPKCVVLT